MNRSPYGGKSEIAGIGGEMNEHDAFLPVLGWLTAAGAAERRITGADTGNSKSGALKIPGYNFFPAILTKE
jgi:hypothetical protein